MNKTILASYKQNRLKGYQVESGSDCFMPMAAKVALQMAKGKDLALDIPFNYSGDTWETDDGFTVVLKVEWDDLSVDDMLGDSYGEIIKRESSYPSDHRDGVDGWELTRESRDGSRFLKIYKPQKGWGFSDRIKQASQAGFSKQNAYDLAMKGLKKEAEKYQQFCEDGIQSVWLQCKAYRTSDYDENGKNAEELGEDSIGGTEESAWKECLIDYQLHENALDSARKAWHLRLANEATEQQESRPDLYQIPQSRYPLTLS